MFNLEPQLQRDSTFIYDLGLSQVRIINNAEFPWIILVPKLQYITEITDLSDSQYSTLNLEIRLTAKMMQAIFQPDKLNIATLGNVISQMHYHIVARFKQDSCFPNTVWGRKFVHYKEEALNERISNIRTYLINENSQ